MPQYFFHVRSPEGFMPDCEGMTLPGLNAVRDEAIAGAQSIIADRLLSGKEPDHRSFEVVDDHGKIILTLPFSEVLRITPILSKHK